MIQSKTIFISTLAASLLVLAGCTLQPTTESASGGNTNTVNENANVEVATNTNETVYNENTNTSDPVLSEVEGWLTYVNDEYGFSFRYPQDWAVDVLDENDEGGMGTNIGSIIMSSSGCRAQGNSLRNSSIEETKKTYVGDINKSLVEINRNGITGIQYYDVVNENNYRGYIYMYLIGQNEFSFRIVDNPDNSECQTTFDEIMGTLQMNS